MGKIRWIAVIFICLVYCFPLWAEGPADDFGFSDYLYRIGEYDRSITEYYRLIYTAPVKDNGGRLSLRLALAYSSFGNFEKLEMILNTLLWISLITN